MRTLLLATLVFVTNEKAGTVTVIDARSDAVVATHPVGGRARGVRVGPQGHLYVAVSKMADGGGAEGIAVLDAAGKLLKRLPAGTDPESFALAGGKLYASNEDAAAATAVDLASGRTLRTVKVGAEPEGVEASPDGKLVLVGCESDDQVAFLDTATDTLLGTVKTASRPRGLAFSKDGQRVYVAAENGHALSILDAAARTLLRSVAVKETEKPMGVALSPDGSRVYVTTGRGNTLLAFDRDGAPIGSLALEGRPWGVAITPDGRKLYVACGLSNSVAVVDAERLKLLKTVPSAGSPWGVAIAP